MANELTVLRAVRDIVEAGDYGLDIQAYHVRPDDLQGDFMRYPPFVTVGLSEDSEMVFDYLSLSTQSSVYTVAVRFYLEEGLTEPGTARFLRLEECKRVIVEELVTLLFAEPGLSGTAIQTGARTAGVAYLYLREKEYTGVMLEFPVLQEV